MANGHLVFTATYSSACPGGGAAFEVTRFGEDASDNAPNILKTSVMLVASRDEPSCANPSPFEMEVTVEVRAPLPALSGVALGATRFLACPPGSLYEMVRVDDASPSASVASRPSFLDRGRRTTTTPAATRPADWDEEEDGAWEPPPAAADAVAAVDAVAAAADDESTAHADPEAEAARVAAELATHEPADSIAFLAHCEAKVAAGEPCGCCSEQMMAALRLKVADDANAAADAATDAVGHGAAANASADADGAEYEAVAVGASGAMAAAAVGAASA